MHQADRRAQLESQVMERAARDPEFREQLKSDPRGTLSRELGFDLHADLTIQVVEDTAATVHLVLPPRPPKAGDELSDQELATSAGGWSGQTDCGTCAGQHTCGGQLSCGLGLHVAGSKRGYGAI